MFTLVLIFCILQYNKTIQNSTDIQNETVSPRRRYLREFGDPRLKKRIDERAYGNLHGT
jgi:hypothetical protein